MHDRRQFLAIGLTAILAFVADAQAGGLRSALSSGWKKAKAGVKAVVRVVGTAALTVIAKLTGDNEAVIKAQMHIARSWWYFERPEYYKVGEDTFWRGRTGLSCQRC